MFKTWFSSSPGAKLKSGSRPANKPTNSRHSAVPAPHRVSSSHGQRRNSTTTTPNDITHLTTKKTHTSIVVRRDGNVEVVTPRATVVLPDTHSKQTQRRNSTQTAPPIITTIPQSNKQVYRESAQRPKRPHSSSSDRLPTRLVTTDSRPRTSHRSGSYGSYGTYERDHDFHVSSYKEPPPIVQVPSNIKYPRRGSYPLTTMHSAYMQEPTPAYPETIYQPIHPRPSPLQRALYPNPAPRPRRSLSNADSISSYYSDYSSTVPRGWFNRRGDQYIRKGVIVMQPPDRQWHPMFAAYPDVGKGWMDENEQFLRQSGGILKTGNKMSLPSDIIIN